MGQGGGKVKAVPEAFCGYLYTSGLIEWPTQYQPS